MEEIREAALAFYEAGSVELKKSAKTIYDNMDVDGDGKISIAEFADFLQRNNYSYEQELFQQLDRNRNGYLDFEGAIVFFYITQTRHVRCDGCRSKIMGIFFTCSDCFYKTKGGYDLCCACYRSRKYESGHGPFLDNYSMLNSVRRSNMQMQQKQSQPTNTQQISRPQQQQSSQPTNAQTNEDVNDLFFEKFLQGYVTEIGKSEGINLANNMVANGDCTIM